MNHYEKSNAELRDRLVGSITDAWNAADALLPYMPTNHDCAVLDVEVLMPEILKTHVVWDREQLRSFLSSSYCDFDCVARWMECTDEALCE